MLNYPKDVLVLTAIRHNITGHYSTYPQMVEEAKKFGIPCTEALETGTSRGMDELKAMKRLEGVEGFVIRFNDGRMYKVRTMSVRAVCVRAYVCACAMPDLTVHR